MDGERKESKDKVQYTVHRIFGRDYQYGKKYRQKRDEVKCIHCYLLQNNLPPKKGWAKV
ncbi:MAG: hypothetical protein JWR23_370 [Mucilaginibacter sp.]|nr:hypothetical protein [Mucilaginibacter sp.]